MPLPPDTMEILRLLVAKDAELRQAGRNPTFTLLQVSGGGVGLKPGVGARVVEPDIRDLIASGDLRDITPAPAAPSMVLRFVVTGEGRANGEPPQVAVELDASGRPISRRPTPTPIEVLRRLADWEDQAAGVLATGGALVNQIPLDFGGDQLEAVCQRIIDMKAADLLIFTDPAGHLPQLAASERVVMGSDFRLTMAGHDRVDGTSATTTMNVTQIVNAVNAQVAAGDITNYVSFTALLDDVQRHLDDLSDIDDGAREEAQSILDKLRSAGEKVATSAIGSGGGAVLGALFTHLLGWVS